MTPRASRVLEKDVRGLEVAVEDPEPVGVVDRLRALRDDPRRLDVGNPLAAHHGVERGSLHQLHGEEVKPVRLAAIVDANDAGVLQASDGLGLAPEPLDESGSSETASVMTLSATSRPSSTCRAWRTTPMAPRPSALTTS